VFTSLCVIYSFFFSKREKERRREKETSGPNGPDFAQDVESDYARNKNPRKPKRFQNTFKLGRNLGHLGQTLSGDLRGNFIWGGIPCLRHGGEAPSVLISVYCEHI